MPLPLAAAALAGTLAAAPTPRLGREVVVEKATRGPVVSLLADVAVRGEVEGDVVALGGDVELGEGAHVHGDVVALGGIVRGRAAVDGRIVGTASLGILGIPGAGQASQSWAMRLLQIGVWMLAVGLLVVLAPRLVRSSGNELARHPVRIVAVGVLALVVWVAVAGLGLALSGTPLGIGVLIVAVAAILAAKLVGVAAVAWLGGRWLASALPVALRAESTRTGLALLGLALLALLPLAGEFLWMAVNLAGIGAAVAAPLGRSMLRTALPPVAVR